MNLLESADVGLLREKLVVQTLFQCRPLGRAVVLQEKTKQNTTSKLSANEKKKKRLTFFSQVTR